MTLRVLSLFAGIGGFDLGLERTGGFKTVAFCEIEPYACKVLAQRWPDVPNLGDVTTAEFPDADIICAGFPCQDISNAGQRAGITGARSGLYGHVVRAIRMVRPRGALLENVAALLGRGMDRVLGDLAEIGHDAEWHCIPASAVGAPHIRDRVWIYAEPQHPDANRIGSYRADLHLNGSPEPANEQVGIVGSLGALLADTAGKRRRETRGGKGRRRPSWGGGAVQHEWDAEPDVGRVAHGIPARVDRLKGLGNAVVPQIPELIGRALLASREAA